MTHTCENIKSQLVEMKGKGLSDKAKLVALLEACGMTDLGELQDILECGASTLRTARAALKNERSKSSTARNQAPENERTARNQAETLEIERQNSSALARANKESPSEIVYLRSITPGGAHTRDPKAGKVAKSARAEQRIRGELDGSHGVLFDDGKLTISDGVIAQLSPDFPDVDWRAVCDKAAPEVGRFSYPSKADAVAVLRKWARCETQSRRPQQAAQQTGSYRQQDTVPTPPGLAARVWAKMQAEGVA